MTELTPELGDAAATSCRCSRNLGTSFDPIKSAAADDYDFHDWLLDPKLYLCAVLRNDSSL